MGVLGASKPWPMSPPLNPADFPGMNPHHVQATVVTNYFHPNSSNSPQNLSPRVQEYVSMRDAAIATAVAQQQSHAQHRGSLFVNHNGQIPLYETVRPKSTALDDFNLKTSGRIENEYSLSPRHGRVRSEVIRPPVPPPLPPNRPASVEMINRNEFPLHPPPATCAPWLKKFKVIKKIKKKIGIGAGSKAGTSFNNLPPLKFHGVHGENVQVFQDGTVAKRINSFCKAIVFSDRPVKVNEKVCLRLIEVSNNWSGVVRFGFTHHDPYSLRNSLPKYVCPDLTSRPGFWAKAFSDKLVKENRVLEFHVNSSGEIHFGIDGEEKEMFLSGVDTRLPLWAVMDIYGNTPAVELVDSRAHLNNSRPSLHSEPHSCSPKPKTEDVPMPSCRSHFSQQRQQQQQQFLASPQPSSIQYEHPNPCASARSLPESQHSVIYGHGSHPQRQSTVSSSYLPLKGLVKYEREGMRGSNTPSGCSSSSSQLPVYKSPPGQLSRGSDYESVYPSKSMSMKPGPSKISNYVSIPSLSKVHAEAMQQISSNMTKVTLTSSSSSSPSKESPAISLECLACCERPVDSVFYSCGHMCMCFQCANAYLETKEKGHCPICRAVISDVIRTYT